MSFVLRERTDLPDSVILMIASLCAIPCIINLVGFSFSLSGSPSDGLMLHTILEWTAVMIAISTAFLAFLHYSMTHDLATPIIGLALFFAGSMDGFRILALHGFIPGEIDPTDQDYIVFTWMLARTFNSLVLIMSAGLFMGKKAIESWEAQGGLRMIIIMSLTFAALSFMVIYFSAKDTFVFKMVYPEAVVARPWDTLPLILFLMAGMFVYPRFYRQKPSLFVHALIVSTIPQMVSQIYAAYGSSNGFDNGAVIASFLKCVGYLVPLVGLLMDYVRTYRLSEMYSNELARSNEELEQFAYVASHDLQEPLRKVKSFAELLAKRYEGKLDAQADKYIGYMVDGADRMRGLIKDLLTYSRVDSGEVPKDNIDLNETLKDVLGDLESRRQECDAQITVHEMPHVFANARQMHQLIQNLIGNAIKYRGERRPEIEVTARQEKDGWVISVSDNGIGFDPKFANKVFGVFQRLHSRGDYEGTGIGLAICKKIVEKNEGRIWVDSVEGEGSTFHVLIPKARAFHQEKTGADNDAFKNSGSGS